MWNFLPTQFQFLISGTLETILFVAPLVLSPVTFVLTFGLMFIPNCLFTAAAYLFGLALVLLDFHTTTIEQQLVSELFWVPVKLFILVVAVPLTMLLMAVAVPFSLLIGPLFILFGIPLLVLPMMFFGGFALLIGGIAFAGLLLFGTAPAWGLALLIWFFADKESFCNNFGCPHDEMHQKL